MAETDAGVSLNFVLSYILFEFGSGTYSDRMWSEYQTLSDYVGFIHGMIMEETLVGNKIIPHADAINLILIKNMWLRQKCYTMSLNNSRHICLNKNIANNTTRVHIIWTGTHNTNIYLN